jgi:hypothetical protein
MNQYVTNSSFEALPYVSEGAHRKRLIAPARLAVTLLWDAGQDGKEYIDQTECRSDVAKTITICDTIFGIFVKNCHIAICFASVSAILVRLRDT